MLIAFKTQILDATRNKINVAFQLERDSLLLVNRFLNVTIKDGVNDRRMEEIEPQIATQTEETIGAGVTEKARPKFGTVGAQDYHFEEPCNLWKPCC